MDWLAIRDRAGRVLAVPNQAPGVPERFGLTREELAREAWVIESSGTRRAGAAAINAVWRELGGPWRTLGALCDLPPLLIIERAVYRWVARHRMLAGRLWSATPACDRPGVVCVD